jgi:hypothetical protein
MLNDDRDTEPTVVKRRVVDYRWQNDAPGMPIMGQTLIARLDSPIFNIAPVRVPDPKTDKAMWSAGKEVTLAGWGYIDTAGTFTSELRTAREKVADNNILTPPATGLMRTTPVVGRGTHGDSGGPLLGLNAAGEFVVIGLFEGTLFGDDQYFNRLWPQAGLIDYINESQYVPTPTPQPAPIPTPLPGAARNLPPTPAYTWSRLAGAGNRVALDGRASTDQDGSVANWTWKNGSTVIATGAQATVSLPGTTSAKITLTVTDNGGASASLTKTLSLPNRPPTIAAVSPAGGVVPSNTPVLSVSASDPDGDSLTYTYHVTGPFVDVTSAPTGSSWKVPPSKLDPGTKYDWTVTVRDPSGRSATRSSNFQVAMLPTAADMVATPSAAGYWQVDTFGGVFAYGDAPFLGSLPGLGVRVTNILGMARTPSGRGYWLVGRDGGVFAFGDAQFYGSLPGLNIGVSNIVGMAPTKTGHGYWLVGSDGGVFSFGDAAFYGSMGGKPLNAPVVSIAVTPTGAGYWLAAGDGGVFAFGDAPFYGSMGGKPLNAPVVDMDATPDGAGYWMTAADGGVFAFGNAGFYGSMAGKPLNGRVTSMARTASGSGYWLTACDGGVFAFGDAPFYGSSPIFQCRA